MSWSWWRALGRLKLPTATAGIMASVKQEREPTFAGLSSRPTLKDVAKLIEEGKAKKIVVMVRSDASTTLI